jgi:hypothetical protein
MVSFGPLERPTGGDRESEDTVLVADTVAKISAVWAGRS